uniref:TAXi_C domain-containing protein n=1 Tax=Macrostomum lignano TaxID=282301 RepID=A0A1I8FIY5_9PLAT
LRSSNWSGGREHAVAWKLAQIWFKFHCFTLSLATLARGPSGHPSKQLPLRYLRSRFKPLVAKASGPSSRSRVDGPELSLIGFSDGERVSVLPQLGIGRDALMETGGPTLAADGSRCSV